MDTAPAKPSVRQKIGRAMLWALWGFLLAPIVVFVIGLGVNHFNPVCGTPGDSGGCEMGLVVAAVGAVMPGAMIGFLIGVMIHFRLGVRHSNTYMLKALGMEKDKPPAAGDPDTRP
jgi:hypothetical protein